MSGEELSFEEIAMELDGLSKELDEIMVGDGNEAERIIGAPSVRNEPYLSVQPTSNGRDLSLAFDSEESDLDQVHSENVEQLSVLSSATSIDQLSQLAPSSQTGSVDVMSSISASKEQEDTEEKEKELQRFMALRRVSSPPGKAPLTALTPGSASSPRAAARSSVILDDFDTSHDSDELNSPPKHGQEQSLEAEDGLDEQISSSQPLSTGDTTASSSSSSSSSWFSAAAGLGLGLAASTWMVTQKARDVAQQSLTSLNEAVNETKSPEHEKVRRPRVIALRYLVG